MIILPVLGFTFGSVDIVERAGDIGQATVRRLSFTEEGVLVYFILVRDRVVPEQPLTVEGFTSCYIFS